MQVHLQKNLHSSSPYELESGSDSQYQLDDIRKKKNGVEKVYICGDNNCGRKYGTNAALYTHIKNKHKGVAPNGTVRPLQEVVKGRKGRPQQIEDKCKQRKLKQRESERGRGEIVNSRYHEVQGLHGVLLPAGEFGGSEGEEHPDPGPGGGPGAAVERAAAELGGAAKPRSRDEVRAERQGAEVLDPVQLLLEDRRAAGNQLVRHPLSHPRQAQTRRPQELHPELRRIPQLQIDSQTQ